MDMKNKDSDRYIRLEYKLAKWVGSHNVIDQYSNDFMACFFNKWCV